MLNKRYMIWLYKNNEQIWYSLKLNEIADNIEDLNYKAKTIPKRQATEDEATEETDLAILSMYGIA